MVARMPMEEEFWLSESWYHPVVAHFLQFDEAFAKLIAGPQGMDGCEDPNKLHAEIFDTHTGKVHAATNSYVSIESSQMERLFAIWLDLL